MELRPHQTKALESVNEIFEENNKAIVVQPTGVGKTYIALGLFEQNKDKRLVFVAPSTAILWHLKLKMAKEYGVSPEEYKKVFPNLELTTYQQMNADRKKSKTYVRGFKADYVVYDEAHHIADNKWGKNAKDIMTSHPETRFLGLTATPERTDGIDVVEQVFDGNLADEMTLEEAVATRLLKMPDYVNAIYSYKPIIEELEERIEELKEVEPERYIMLKKDMEKAKKALEKADGMSEIFAKHIQEKDGRFIVFCKDIEHLKQMVETSKKEGWFKGVNANVETLEIHSEEDNETNRRVLKRFKGDFEATDGTLRVLFSVAKINEGIHLDNLSGVIMLRPTKSKIIFRQQLGRTMSISESAKHTTAFDIVNNIDSFQDMHDFMEQVMQIRIQNNPDISPEDIRQQAMEEFNITSETRDVREILEKVAGGLEADWESHYQRSVRWREEHSGQAPKVKSKNKEEKNIYGWESVQKWKYLKPYQDVDEREIPEEYREKVKKLKELGLEYVPTNYKTVEEHFEAWKNWVLEHDDIPSRGSQDEEEIRITRNMVSALYRMKKQPEQYKEIIDKYERLYAQYGKKKTVEQNFELWKSWTIEHRIIPSEYSENEEEKRVARKIRRALRMMSKKPEKYKAMLDEYGRLLEQYAKSKTFAQRFELWKSWTVENGITPSLISEDEEEKRIAKSIFGILQGMKRKPEQYKKLLDEYEELYAQYGKKKTVEQNFELWKTWTIEHGISPTATSQDEEERKIAANMSSTLLRMKKKPEQYKEMLDEYEMLYTQYGRQRKSKTFEEHFEEWKSWTLEHGINPSSASEDEEEKRIAKSISVALTRMRKNPEQYKEILDEYQMMYTQYGRQKDNKTAVQRFEEWKAWVLECGALPSAASEDEKEKRLAMCMIAALNKMRTNPKRYREILDEHYRIYKQYSKIKSYKTGLQNFELWKNWTLEHGITPAYDAKDEDEKRIANNMSTTRVRMRKKPEEYREVLSEYEKLCAQYGRSKLRKLQGEKEQELSEVRDLRTQAEQAEELDRKTQETLDVAIDEQSQKPEGPGE